MIAVFLNHSMSMKLMWMGVDLFFILSGFLITGVLLDARQHSLGQFFGQFYARRARRILIPYVIFLAFGTLLVGTAWTQHWYFYVLLANLLAPLNIPHPSMFDSLWSLAVEEQFYLAWPFAVYFLDKRHLRQICLFLIILAPVLRASFHFAYHWPIYMLTPFRMDLLATGALLCLEWRDRREEVEKWGARIGIPLSIVGVAILLLLSHFGYSTYGNSRIGNVFIYEACLMVCLGFMLYALGNLTTAWLKTPPITYIGKISYSMYLVHSAALYIVFPRIHGILGALIAFGLTVGYAAISWHVLESRLLSRRHSASIAKPAAVKLGPQTDSSRSSN
jgi:peptidoglycan/LPS O-acetylase OafA/YrhL